MLKRGLSIFIAMMLLTGVFVGCEKKEVTSNERMKFTINVMDAEKNGKDEAYKYISQKFNVDFEFIPVNWTDWNEKVRIWMSTGDMPDVMWWDFKPYNIGEYKGWIEQGLLKGFEITDKYPNLYKKSQTMKSAKYFEQDGKMYSWPSSRDNDQNNNYGLQMFYYRQDWAKKLGLYKEEYTWEEFEALAKAFKDNDMAGHGVGKTIGLGGVTLAFPVFAGVQQASPNWETFVKKDGKYVWGLEQPETLEGIKVAKALYDSGALWRDNITAQNNEGLNKFVAGEMGILYDNWTLAKTLTTRNKFETANSGLKFEDCIAPMIVKGKNGKVFTFQDEDFWTVTGFNPKLSDAQLDRLLSIYDWILSPEGKKMATMGVEGHNFTIKDGKVEFIKGDGTKSNALLSIPASNASYSYENPAISDIPKKMVLSVFERLKKDDVLVRSYDYDLNFLDKPKKNKIGSYRDEGFDKMKQLVISSKAENIEKEWNDWLSTRKASIDEVLSELNQ